MMLQFTSPLSSMTAQHLDGKLSASKPRQLQHQLQHQLQRQL